jgi:hypothetical protein
MEPINLCWLCGVKRLLPMHGPLNNCGMPLLMDKRRIISFVIMIVSMDLSFSEVDKGVLHLYWSLCFLIPCVSFTFLSGT